MKKLFVLLLLLMSTVVFSETLGRIDYRSGVFTGTLKENKKVNIQAIKGRTETGSVLILELPNVKNNAVDSRILEDSYLDSVSITEQGDGVKIYFFLKDGTDYTVLNSKNFR